MDIEIILEGKKARYVSSDTIDTVRYNFSVENSNPNAKYNNRFYSINPVGFFDIGLLGEVTSFVKDKFPNANITVCDNLNLAYNPSIYYSEIKSVDGFVYYDYQYEAIKNMLDQGRGIISLPTAAGKTLVMGGFCKTFIDNNPEGKILIIVPYLTLLNKTQSDLADYGIPSVKWSGKNCYDPNHNILISTTQFLVLDLKRTSILKDYDVVIIDEAHTIKRDNKINKVLSLITTNNKFGLTGTVPKEMLDRWNVIGKTGPIIIEKKSYELRNDIGSISDVNVKILKLQHSVSPPKYSPKKHELFRPTGQYDLEVEFLYNREWRNQFIANMALRLDGNSLILVDRLFHGEILTSILSKSTDKVVKFICGDTPIEERDEILNDMELNDNIVCVSMDKIFSTGISVKNLKYVIFVCIGKSYTKVLQSIGRSLRLHKNKKRAYIFDVSDNTKYSSKHLGDRITFYNEEKIDYEIRKIKENS